MFTIHAIHHSRGCFVFKVFSSPEPQADQVSLWYTHSPSSVVGCLSTMFKRLLLKPIIVCLNDNPRVTWAFIWENDTMMDSLEIIAACDLEVG